MGKECRFCNIVNGGHKVYEDIDTPIMTGNKYFSVVSIGAFVKGWTLLVTNEHRYNLSHDYSSIDFYNFMKKHISFVKRKLAWNGQVVVFEHGANKCDSETACGTSHAHLHVLPFSDSILDDIMNEKDWIQCEWKNVENLVGQNEYLLYCEEPEKEMDAKVYIHIVTVPESQFFRRVIFNKLKLQGSYSYKEDARYEESMETHKILEE